LLKIRHRTAAPNAFGDGKCGGDNINLQANCSGDGNTPVWYDAASGGNQLFIGNNYTVDVTETTSFWVSCTTPDGCAGPRAEVVATFKTIPVAPTVDGTGATQCYYDGIKITANASTSDGSSVVWYDGASNIVADPSLDHVGTVTYYARAVSGSGVDLCASIDVATAVLTINVTPDAPIVTPTDNCDGTTTLVVTWNR
jgi:hypothetical protein